MSETEIRRLGAQQKEILRFMYERKGEVRQQVNIIESLYDGVTNSRKASVSRSISKLREAGLVYEQNVVYYPAMDAWCKARPRYGITEDGKEFVEEDERFSEF